MEKLISLIGKLLHGSRCSASLLLQGGSFMNIQPGCRLSNSHLYAAFQTGKCCEYCITTSCSNSCNIKLRAKSRYMSATWQRMWNAAISSRVGFGEKENPWQGCNNIVSQSTQSVSNDLGKRTNWVNITAQQFRNLTRRWYSLDPKVRPQILGL